MVLNIISLGAGVQSSTMSLMAARGEISPMPDAAIFADTGAEPKAVYVWLDWLEKQLPFPVYRVSEGNLREDIRSGMNSTRQRFAAVPWFVRTIVPAGREVHVRGDNGEVEWSYITTKDEVRDGMGRRQCTAEYKLKPIRRKLRELAGLPKGARSKGIHVVQWIGISRDEIIRMKPSRDAWCENRHPLIEIGMTREGCLRWMAERQYPTPPERMYVLPVSQQRRVARSTRQRPRVLAGRNPSGC